MGEMVGLDDARFRHDFKTPPPAQDKRRQAPDFR